MQLKIVSLNLAGFKDWPTREQKIVDFLNEARPDVVLLQEVKFDAGVSAYSQSASLNALLANPFPYNQTTISKFYQPISGEPYREGLAVLSSFPIENSEALVFNKQPDDKQLRIVQNVDISIDGEKVSLSNIHLSNNKYSSEQLAELLSILKSRGERRIIAGDFNIFHLQEHSALYEGTYTASTDFKEYISFPTEGHTFDYVLIPKNMSFMSLEVHEGLSDHGALVFVVNV